MKRPAIRLLSLLSFCLLFTAGVYAQDVTVTGVRGLNFGKLYVLGLSEVAYNSTSSAEFTVTGKRGKRVRISASATSMFRFPLSILLITVTNSHCGYSLDNGATWNTFTTGLLFHDVTIPNGSGTIGTIRVRVGGLVLSTSLLQKGAFTGLVTVRAEYR